MSRVIYIHVLLISLVPTLMSGCAGQRTSRPLNYPHIVKRASDLATNQLLVVGKIEVFPPIQPVEQRNASKSYQNKVSVLFDKESRAIWKTPWGQYEDGVMVPIGELFLIALPQEMICYNGAVIPMKTWGLGNTQWSAAELPGGALISQKQNGRFLYIGTIRYTRDEFFDIIRVDVIDEFYNANDQFEQIFGKSFSLKRSFVHSEKKNDSNKPKNSDTRDDSV